MSIAKVLSLLDRETGGDVIVYAPAQGSKDKWTYRTTGMGNTLLAEREVVTSVILNNGSHQVNMTSATPIEIGDAVEGYSVNDTLRSNMRFTIPTAATSEQIEDFIYTQGSLLRDALSLELAKRDTQY